MLIRLTEKIVPSDTVRGDQFGKSVSTFGRVAAIGAYNDDDRGSDSGAVYLFDVSTGNQTAKITPSDGIKYDYFGGDVSITNDLLVVGAPGDDDRGKLSGSAYIFDSSTGRQIFKLVGSTSAPGDRFGAGTAIDGDVIAIGALWNDDVRRDGGVVYLFDRTSGAEIRRLYPNDLGANDLFGYSLSVSGNRIVVGGYQNQQNGKNSGAAYVFDVNTGAQLHRLQPNDPRPNDNFGWSVDLSGSIAAIGTSRGSKRNRPQPDATYLFNVETGEQIAKLVADDNRYWPGFGLAVAVSGPLVAVGAQLDSSNGKNSGAVYLFDSADGRQVSKLVADDGIANDVFGLSVGLSDTHLVVGAADKAYIHRL